jgi:hypothetical protein
MMVGVAGLGALSSDELLAATWDLVGKSHVLEADLLEHLGEVDERKLYLECACSSMFAFCVGELGFSEEAAYNRITVARAARRWPAVMEAARSGRVHLTGLRLLAPHLTAENQAELLAEAAGKSKREIEEIVARLAPRAPVATSIRKVRAASAAGVTPGAPAVDASSDVPVTPGPVELPAAAGPEEAVLAVRPELPLVRRLDAEGGPPLPVEPYLRHGQPGPPPPFRAPRLATPLAQDLFKIQFTATRVFCDMLREAQDLLRHSVPDGDTEVLMTRALRLLIAEVKKERFGVGRKARPVKRTTNDGAASRQIPDAIKRAVWERDGGRCTYRDKRGKRCEATAFLTFEHDDGFARTRTHSVDRIRLLCHAHNQHAAEEMYGREFMEKARARAAPGSEHPGPPGASQPTRPGTGSGPSPPASARA